MNKVYHGKFFVLLINKLFNLMDIVHRANNLGFFYKQYYQNNCRAFEIDVQSGNGTILVYHDDLSYILPKHGMTTLEEFLRFTPKFITINIEIKKYNSKNINLKLIELLKQYPSNKYILSSFDKGVCKELLSFNYPVMYLFSKLDDYDKTFPNICIPKILLYILLDLNKNHEKVYVYQVDKTELKRLKQKYPFVKGWIYD